MRRPRGTTPRPRDDRPRRKAIGITCGVGSMLVGARAAGFEVVGNVEWRKYYLARDADGRSTFTDNFPGAIVKQKITDFSTQEIERLMEADIALGHPECGNFSHLSGANANREQTLLDPADIPLFCDLVAQLKPRFFVMDDLPKSFIAFPMEKYAEKLPEYDLFPEWISNWGYGNAQRGRDRLFMIGALKSERWAFRPGEAVHDLTVADVIGDLSTPSNRSNIPNHDPQDLSADCPRAFNLGKHKKKNTWADAKKYFEGKPGGFTLSYDPGPAARKKRIAEDKDPMVKRIGFLKGHWDGPAHVLTGGNPTMHHHRCEPYTIRERARLQGFPDDFVFYGTKLNDRGEWDHANNQHMIRQTGKAMPIQFCTYVSKQIMAHLEGQPFVSSGARVKPRNEYVDAAKLWYCENIGYADPARACGECWMRAECSIRTGRYGLPPIEPDDTLPPKRNNAKRSRATRTE